TRLEVDRRLTATIVAATDEGPSDRPRGPDRKNTTRGPVASGSDRYLLTIAPKADAPLGRVFAEVAVSTSDARVPRIPIQVILGLQAPVEVSPDRVTFEPGAPVQHLTVVRPDGGKLAVLGVTAKTRDVKATVTRVRPDHEYDVTIRWVGKPGQTIRSSVTVRTNERRRRAARAAAHRQIRGAARPDGGGGALGRPVPRRVRAAVLRGRGGRRMHG